MNTDLNLLLAQMLNKQEVDRSSNERLIKEIQSTDSSRGSEENQG